MLRAWSKTSPVFASTSAYWIVGVTTLEPVHPGGVEIAVGTGFTEITQQGRFAQSTSSVELGGAMEQVARVVSRIGPALFATPWSINACSASLAVSATPLGARPRKRCIACN